MSEGVARGMEAIGVPVDGSITSMRRGVVVVVDFGFTQLPSM